jgi:hypothetical protein
MKQPQNLWIPVIIILIGSMMGYAQGGNQYVKVKSENLRNQPSGEKIGELNGGTQVEVLERRPNWVKVQLTGWIWEQSLTSDPTRVEGFKLSASHILLTTEAEANRVLKELKSGKGFAEMAKLFSQDKASAAKGGSLGTFSRGDLLPEFEDTALKLKKGEISGVVKTTLGFHIIRRDQ